MSDRPEYLRKLNDQQYEAATTVEGPILILAGAGSGKTGTMTHRIAYMVKEAGISPYSILAVTFTNKAAGEMRDRVEALIGPVTGMWIQTFHSACLRILRSDADRLGYKKSFVIYDPVDQKALMKSLVKERELDDKHYAPAYVLSEISKAKEKQLSPEDFRRHYGDMDHYRKLAELYSAYETELLKNNAMDFDDLILNTVRLFESEPDVLESYRRKFRYIMVDEYQDTNMLQYRLVSLLAKEHRNICVVGDDDQCIYEWRGADIRNIMEFEKDFPGARVIKLEQNYRSTGNILEAAHSVISKNRGRKDKKLWTGAGAGEKVEYHRADSDTEEARYAAARIEAMRRKDPDLKYSDFAILYRANVQSRRFEDCLSGRSIPYQVLSGLRYYDRKEIKDILAYMRLVQDPDDDVSFLRIVNEPKRGAGDKALELIRSSAAENHTSLLEAMIAPEVLSGVKSATAEAFKSLYELVISLGSEREGMAVADIYDTLLVKSGYLPALEEQDSVEADARIENLLEFKSVIVEKEKESSAAGEKLTLLNSLPD
ncbi:MAG: UvrD-helicase domain-containing protein [Firmicutes bacterium]|nr:UvrD-helicase domain-containing protein [Bacillota bacterium]